MIRAQIVDSWVPFNGSGFIYSVQSKYAVKAKDVTNQDPSSISEGLDPDSVVVEIECSESVYDEIEADATILVLWSEVM